MATNVRLAANTQQKLDLLKAPGSDIKIVERGHFTVMYEKDYVESFSWTSIRTASDAGKDALNIPWVSYMENNPGKTMPADIRKFIDNLKIDLAYT